MATSTIPKSCIVITDPLSEPKFLKLRQWLDSRDRIEVSTDSKKRVYLLNNTRIDDSRAEANGEGTRDITKAYHEMVTVKIVLARRFYDFIEGYLQFFAEKTTIEDFCRTAAYEAIKTLYKNFEVSNRFEMSMHIPEADWFRKWEALSFIMMPEERDLPSYEAGVQFTNKEFLDDIEKAAEKQQMDRDEFIRYVMRRELDRLGR